MVDNLLGTSLCCFCSAKTQGTAICAGCRRSLPWNHCACPGCARPQIHAAPCPACLKKPLPFDRAWATFRLEAPVQQGVHQLKYHAGLNQARLLGTLMGQRLAQRSQPLPTLVIPVPLHDTRLMRRGYNQALELARGVQRVLDIEVDASAARRLRRTRDQIGLTPAQRRRNVHEAFAIDARVAGRHIALLDDVMTTGATLADLARAARHAGATRIEAWALARAT
ncbi:MAG: ComF family protein [Stenotrophobium sp.]